MINGDDRKIKYETAIILLENTRDNCYPISLAHKDAINIAIETLEKQIPKKVKISPDDYGTCPNCKNVMRFTGEYRYCSNCGQALDWRDTL